MTTARSIINQSLKQINALGRGQSLSNEDAQDALNVLNNMLGSWSVEGGLVFTQDKETFSLTGAQSYTIGSGGNFNTVRPFQIDAINATNGVTDYPLAQNSVDQYASIADKSTGGIPSLFYYDNNSPLGNIYLYPVPDATYSLTIYSRKPLTEFTTLDTDVTLPAGYEHALVTNLAVLMCPYYEKPVMQDIKEMAAASKGNVFIYNNRNNQIVSAIDDALLINENIYNIYGGY